MRIAIVGYGRMGKLIRSMEREMRIPEKLQGIREEDIPQLAAYADREANPLYPVPMLMDADELSVFYRAVMEEKKSGRIATTA